MIKYNLLKRLVERGYVSMRKISMVLICGLFCFLSAGCSKGEFLEAAANSGNDAYTEVLMEVGSEKPLEAVLTMPKTPGNPPVVVMVQGSGPSDKDETIEANKPFADIAHGLALQGIASLRYDKRTYTYPTDFSKTYTIDDEVLNDAKNAITLVENDKNLGDIFVLGHSLGGMMAPKIAQENPKVSGLILMAGSPRNLTDIMYDQNVEAVGQAKLPEEKAQETLQEVKTLLDEVKALRQGDTGTYLGIPAEYWVSLNEIDTPAIASGLNIPMLIQQGDADFQVSVAKDYNAWEQVLAGKSNVVFKLYKNLNHLFMESNGKKDISEYQIKSTVSPQVIEDIVLFIKENKTTKE